MKIASIFKISSNYLYFQQIQSGSNFLIRNGFRHYFGLGKETVGTNESMNKQNSFCIISLGRFYTLKWARVSSHQKVHFT